MIETALKRKERENPYKGIRLPDNVRGQTKHHSKLPDMIGEYAEFVDKEVNFDEIEDIIQQETAILRPAKIDEFLQKTKYFEDHMRYKYNTGLFISKLIQSSYNNGYNDFELNIKDLDQINSLGRYLKGDKDNRIRIKLIGDAGNATGAESEHCEFIVEGNVDKAYGNNATNSFFYTTGNVDDWCGSNAIDCSFYIEKDMGNWCGNETNNSRFYILGDVNEYIGKGSIRSEFYINGVPGEYLGNRANQSKFMMNHTPAPPLGSEANTCIFSTTDPQTYTSLKQMVKTINTIRLKDDQGNTIKKEII